MGIEYMIRKTSLTNIPGAHLAHVVPGQPAEMDEIIERIAEHNTTVSKPDILSVLEDFYVSIEKMLLEGRNVNTPMASFRTSIIGRFEGINDTFEGNRHRIMARVIPGNRLRAAVAKAEPIKLETTDVKPNPNEYIDMNSGVHDSTLTSGGMGELLGYRLVFDPADLLQGIFFRAQDGTETRVQIVGRNMPKDLLFTVPVLPAGTYTVLVRAVMRGTTDVREGVLKPQLTVA